MKRGEQKVVSFYMDKYMINNNWKVVKMNDYYLLIGLNKKEVKITNISQNDNGIVEVSIESKKKKVRCPLCGKFTSSVHDKLKPIRSVYLDSCGTNVDLIIYKKRYHCYNCNKIFMEDLAINTSKGNISNKVKIQIRKDLLNYNLSFKYIADRNRISITTVENEMMNIISSMPEHVINLPKVISFDEFKADTKQGKYAFILNDPIHKKVLDVLPQRKKERLLQYFTYCKNRHSVEFVISDMYEPYLQVTQIMFPKAKYVVDRYHYITYIMDALDSIRIRLQNTYGEKSKEYKLLKNKKNVSLLRKYSNDIDWWVYTKRYKNGHMIDILPINLLHDMFDISAELKEGYYLKEEFLDIVHHSKEMETEKQIDKWISKCISKKIPEFIEAAGTISRWKEYIINSFIDERYSNGFTEGRNNKIKVIKRVAFGYKSFELLRGRILYVFGGKISGIIKNKNDSKLKK